MQAYSVDLRARVLSALARGMPRNEIVSTFGVSLATIKRWLYLQRTGLPLTPKPTPGRRRTIRREHHADLQAHLTAHNDATLETV